jgi:hypothetical protein
VSPQAALDAGSGADAVRALVPAGQKDELDGVLKAYSESLRNVFYFLTGLACLAVFVSLGIGWKDVRNKMKVDAVKEEDHVEEKRKDDV